jgi:hypothetical protein
LVYVHYNLKLCIQQLNTQLQKFRGKDPDPCSMTMDFHNKLPTPYSFSLRCWILLHAYIYHKLANHKQQLKRFYFPT